MNGPPSRWLWIRKLWLPMCWLAGHLPYQAADWRRVGFSGWTQTDQMWARPRWSVAEHEWRCEACGCRLDVEASRRGHRLNEVNAYAL